MNNQTKDWTQESIVMVNSKDAEPILSSRTEHPPTSLKTWVSQKKQLMTYTCYGLTCLAGLITLIVLLTLPKQDIIQPENLFNQTTNALSYFDASIIEGYSQCHDLENDLKAAAKYIVDVRVDINSKSKFQNDYGYSSWIPRGGFFGEPMVSVMEESFETSSSGTNNKETSTAAGNGEDSFGTNNQVDGVEEADLIQSDGKVVYAAYGNQIVIWNATSGDELSRTILPTDDDEGTPLCNDSEKSLDDNCYQPQWYQSDVRINSLLLNDERLVVIANAPFTLGRENSYDTVILEEYRRTRVFVYDISSIPMDKNAIPLLGRKDLQGSYQTARSIDNRAHIVTNSQVNTWHALDKHIDPWRKEYDGLLENEYRQAAYENVEPFISNFASTLAREIMSSHGMNNNSSDITADNDCAQIAKIALMVRRSNQAGDATNDEKKTLSFTTEGVLNNYVQVHSFDIQEMITDSILTVSQSGVFLPTASYTQSVYASEEKLIISGNAYSEDSDHQWNERTMLLAFDLHNGTAIASSVGEVPGSVLNQFSMDHYNQNGHDYVRVATTTWAQFGVFNDTWQQTSESTNQVTILKLPTTVEDNASTESTKSMEIVGQATDLGVGERIYAARFMNERGYVVTFRQVDPFYTLNLTDPSNPFVVGELKIPGFSNYLHPVNDDLILALGQDASENGLVQGLQIAMFNVSDFANPQQIHKYVETGYSSSDAQYDHKAFRYLPESKLLMLPLSIYWPSEEYFDGFIVYDVDEEKEKFSKHLTISHMDESSTCWDDASLTSRSLVFDGKVTTTKQHTVLSHDLVTLEKLWELNLDNDRDSSEDECWYWYSGGMMFL